MAYKLEYFAADHQEVLKGTLLEWSKTENDIYLVSSEGHKIFTQKILLYFYSSNLGSILDSLPSSTLPVGISLSVSSNSISNLIKLLTTGEAASEKKENLTEVKEAAKALGINLGNCLLEAKKRSSQVTIKKISATTEVKTNIFPPDIFNKKVTNFKLKDADIANVTKKWNTVIVAQNKITHISKDDVKVTNIKRETTDSEKKEMKHSLKCDVCFKIFREKRYLRRHRYRKHGISMKTKPGRPKSGVPGPEYDSLLTDSDTVGVKAEDFENVAVKFPCTDCQKEFNSGRKLYRHRLQHTNNFKCDQCEKSFPTNGALRLHKNIHLDEKPFNCDECDKGFAQAGNLKTHKLRYHEGNDKQQSVMSSDNVEGNDEQVEGNEHVEINVQFEEENAGIANDKCNFCDEHFDDSSELNAHMILMHSIQEMIQSSD